MSGIVGAWDLGGRPLGSELLTAMLERIGHRGQDGLSVWGEGAIGLGCALRRNTAESGGEVQPFVHASGSVIVFDGRLDDREELISALESRPEADALAPDPELVMAAYEAFGESFVEKLSGDFAFAIFDPAKQWLVMARDPIGARPLHFFRSRDTFLFASEISALLSHPSVETKPNLGQLAQYLQDGTRSMEASTTFFEDIHSLLPANVAIVTPSRFVTRRYWDFDGARHLRFESPEGYLSGFGFQLERAVRRRMRTVGEVQVGGGATPLDASLRAIALDIRRDDVAVTAPTPCTVDELAAAVAASESPSTGASGVCGMPRSAGAGMVMWGPPADAMFQDRTFLVDLAGHLEWGELAAHLRSLSESSEEPGAYGRFAADFFSSHAPPFLARRRARGTAPEWYSEGFKESGDGLASAEPVRRGDFATHHSRAIYGLVRSWRTVLEMESANKIGAEFGMEVAFPFMDRDLLAFLMAIPGEERSRPGFPFAILGQGPDAGVQLPTLGLDGLQDAISGLAEAATCSRFDVTDQVRLAVEVPSCLLRAQSGDLGAVRDLRALLGTEMWLQSFFT